MRHCRFDYDDASLIEMIEHIEAFTMEKLIGPIVGTNGIKYIPPFRACYNSVKVAISTTSFDGQMSQIK